jgi:hypothetical protein
MTTSFEPSRDESRKLPIVDSGAARLYPHCQLDLESVLKVIFGESANPATILRMMEGHLNTVT